MEPHGLSPVIALRQVYDALESAFQMVGEIIYREYAKNRDERIIRANIRQYEARRQVERQEAIERYLAATEPATGETVELPIYTLQEVDDQG